MQTATNEIAPACFEIERAELDKALADWRVLAAGARLRWLEGGQIPGLAKGKAWPGIAVSHVRPASLWELIGLRDGDVVYAFNGYSLTGFDLFVSVLSDPDLTRELQSSDSPRKALDSLFGTSVTDVLVLSVVRGGKELVLHQVLEGTALTECYEVPRLNERDAEERTWTEADWQADAKRAEQRQAVFDAAAAEREAVANAITPTSATSFEISSAISSARLRAALAGDHVRSVTAIVDGNAVGMRIYAVRPQGVYAALGFENGDTIVSVAGVQITSTDALVEQLGKLPEHANATVGLTRRGASVTLTYVVK
ncbi:MAG: hypothetical protein HOV81_39680 [Kofleriaceae bacterium]|nr:hypothetical protein [Kofleriaceae bacterium]